MSINTAPPAYDLVASSDESTVVSQYIPDARVDKGHQSEAQLEAELIRVLTRQAYEYLPITCEEDLIANLRKQLETLNGVQFSDTEWKRFYTDSIAGANESIADKTRRIQTDHVQVLTRDDGTSKNIALIDKNNIFKNRLQVINQYVAPDAHDGSTHNASAHTNRYDVTILVNGLPLVHIELKRRGIDIREAFNQIERYQRDSFWSGSGLYEYVQLFVISNGTLTKYYSNTTRHQHLAEHARKTSSNRGRKTTSHSFEFTSWWADATNTPIRDLISFAKTFLAKHAILSILTKYCVLTANQTLLVMRPYQIVATERIIEKIALARTYKKEGSVDGGGYIWHTTGSGKTLTSFKTAQLAAKEEGVDRVIFVVDRKDLDHQTRLEYERFSPGSVNGNTNTAALRRQLTLPVGAPLESRGNTTVTNQKILVTTIQKLSRFIATEKNHPIYNQRVVMIFDECHRSQFGDMHTHIVKHFKRYHLFGFTGTPIFAENAASGGKMNLKTTEQAFGQKLHTYTIVDAINDGNVLPFRIDYINTMRVGDVANVDVEAIDHASAYNAPERLKEIVRYILDNFDTKTKRASSYDLKGARKRGFNALFAVESIPAARAYYTLFQEMQQDLPSDKRLSVATIYSYGANEAVGVEDTNGFLAEEDFDPANLDQSSRDFLESVMADYNSMYGTQFDTSSDGFQKYYEHLADQMKNRNIDLVIVVNMFLTGFDATTMNTLFVDKNLRSHGLIQAYSRTNRILNSVKTFGNIVCFRNLEKATEDALALFGNKDAKGIVVLKPYLEYFQEYLAKLDELHTVFTLGESEPQGEEETKHFINVFGAILRLRNILECFDDFTADDPLPDRDFDDYKSFYLDLSHKMKPGKTEKEDIHDDVVFELELVKRVEVTVDYILMLVKRFVDARGNGEDKEIRAEIRRVMGASPSLHNKRDLVEAFIDSVSVESDIPEAWREFVIRTRDSELDELIQDERLKDLPTRELVARSFKDGELHASGQSVTRILPPVSRFSASGREKTIRSRVVEKLNAFFERFNGLLGE